MLNLYLILILATHSFLVQAMAGKEGGNGGGLSVCKYSTAEGEEILEARLYDFVEAEILESVLIDNEFAPKIKIKETDGPYLEQIRERIENVRPLFPDLAGALDLEFWIAMKSLKKLPVQLERILDSEHVYLPQTCRSNNLRPEYAQVARYLDSEDLSKNRLEVVKHLYDELAPTDKAGLIFHEMLYRLYRRAGQGDSKEARRLNAFMFSEPTEYVNKELEKMLGKLYRLLFLKDYDPDKKPVGLME